MKKFALPSLFLFWTFGQFLLILVGIETEHPWLAVLGLISIAIWAAYGEERG